MATSATDTRGKTGFVKEFLNDNPQANPKLVNEAWKKAGMDGSISSSLVNKQRSDLGLTGNLRTTAKPSKGRKKAVKKAKMAVATFDASPLGLGMQPQPKKRGRPAKAKGLGGGEVAGATGDRQSKIAAVEADLDRLLFRVMSVGQMPRVEEGLRAVRRILYKNHV